MTYFNERRYHLQKEIGDGVFGKALLVLDKKEKSVKKVLKEIEIKGLKRKNESEIVKIVIDYMKEALVLAKMNHPHIITYFDSFSEGTTLYIVTEYCEDGDLRRLIEKNKVINKKLSEFELITWSLQLVSALDYIHEQGMMHRDIKPENIFIKQNKLKLGDFGLSKSMATLSKYYKAGTPKYMSPERFLEDKYEQSADVWSLGCVLIELCTYEFPFNDLKELVESKIKVSNTNSGELMAILKKMLSIKPSDRPLPKSVLKDFEVIQIKSNQCKLLKSASEVLKKSITQVPQMKPLTPQPLTKLTKKLGASKFEVKLAETYDSKRTHVVKIPIGSVKDIKETIESRKSKLFANLKQSPFKESTFFASGSSDKTIKIYDLNKTLCVFTLKSHENDVLSLVSLASGQLASGSSDCTIKLWDIIKKICTHTFKGHSGSIKCMKLTNDGLLASGSSDKTIKLWDLDKRSCVSTLTGHTSVINCLVLLKNGNLASASCDKSIKIWDLSKKICLSTLNGHAAAVRCIELLNENALVSSSCDKSIKIWDITKMTCMSISNGSNSDLLCLELLQGDSFASGSWDNCIKIWNMTKKTCIKTLTGHESDVLCLRLLGSNLLASGSADKSVKIWDLSKNSSCVYTFKSHESSVKCIELLTNKTLT